MPSHSQLNYRTVLEDLTAGLVVFLVAIPLCLGISLASNAPIFSGLIAGIVGGIVVGLISGSHTSVTGPAAGLTAIVSAQITHLGSFEAFLLAVIIAGVIQVIMSLFRLGFIAAFFPSSVIKGLLAAIGVIIILKQIPHLVGHDLDPIGNKSFFQADQRNTLTEIFATLFDFHYGAALVGVLSLGILFCWEKIEFLKKSLLPAPVFVVIFGIIANHFLVLAGENWEIGIKHLVQVPVAKNLNQFLGFFNSPDFNILRDPKIYMSGFVVALVASLETLLNIEAVDKIDPLQRSSPPNRELFAQGVGNIVAGLLGGLPMTSVIIRSSVNINAGVKTKLSTIFHGILIILTVVFIPDWLNKIPLSALAAILFVTGIKLASPQLVMQMWKEGKNQFLPFIITLSAIVFSDILTGILIGLAVSIAFILNSFVNRPIKKIIEKHPNGEQVLHIKLPNQVGFFNRAKLEDTLRKIPRGGNVLIDAIDTDYIDPDILDLFSDFQNKIAKAHGVKVSLAGFKDKYPNLDDKIEYIDYTNREAQQTLKPEEVLNIFKEGNIRFRKGERLTRQVDRMLKETSHGQFPLAVVLSCIDSRSPTELIFDLTLGDIFSVRIAGNTISEKVLGSIEFACAISGAKLILVLGHTSCGAVKAAIELTCQKETVEKVTGCPNLTSIVNEIQLSIDRKVCEQLPLLSDEKKNEVVNEVARLNVLHTIQRILEKSSVIETLVKENKVGIYGAIYNIKSGEVDFFS